jgi:hypothetical protein
MSAAKTKALNIIDENAVGTSSPLPLRPDRTRIAAADDVMLFSRLLKILVPVLPRHQVHTR